MLYLSELWNIQWWNVVGIILAILGTLYTGSNYLDKRYLIIRTITKSLAVGIIIAFLFTCFTLFSVLITYLNQLLFNALYHRNAVLPSPDSVVDFSILIPGGLIIGVILGMFYSFQRESKDSFDQNLFLVGLIGLIVMVCCSVGTEALILTPGLFSAHPIIFNLVLYSSADIGGCLLGIVLARAARPAGTNFLIFSLLFVMFFLSSLLFSNHGQYIFNQVLDWTIYNAQLGLLVGISINNWRQLKPDPKVYPKNDPKLGPKPEVKKVSWEEFLVWLAFGGLFIPLVYLAIFKIDTTNKYFIFFTQHYFLIVGIVNSQGDKLIKQIKFRGHYNYKDGNVYPLINWKRFVYGLIIGILYVTPVIIFFFMTDLLLGYNITIATYDLFQNINFALLVGLIIGFIYGFGQLIIYQIEGLKKEHLGRMSIVIAVLGILIAAIPH